MSERKVVAIDPTRAADIPNPEPDQTTIEYLERWLQLARDGRINGVAIVGISPAGSNFTGWDGSCAIERTAAAIGLLQFRFMRAWDQAPE